MTKKSNTGKNFTKFEIGNKQFQSLKDLPESFQPIFKDFLEDKNKNGIPDIIEQEIRTEGGKTVQVFKLKEFNRALPQPLRFLAEKMLKDENQNDTPDDLEKLIRGKGVGHKLFVAKELKRRAEFSGETIKEWMNVFVKIIVAVLIIGIFRFFF